MIFILCVIFFLFVFGVVLYIFLISLLFFNVVVNVFKKVDFFVLVFLIIKMLMYGIFWDIGYDNFLKNVR